MTDLTPAWVMCGLEPVLGQVILFASKDLTQAELEEHADDPLYFDESPLSSRVYPSRREYTLSTTMRSFVKIQAADWPSAFAALFARWSPDTDQRLEIGQQHALDRPRQDDLRSE